MVIFIKKDELANLLLQSIMLKINENKLFNMFKATTNQENVTNSSKHYFLSRFCLKYNSINGFEGKNKALI